MMLPIWRGKIFDMCCNLVRHFVFIIEHGSLTRFVALASKWITALLTYIQAASEFDPTILRSFVLNSPIQKTRDPPHFHG